MLILNDLHLGCRRSGGTTPSSQAALRAYQFSSIRQVLAEVDDDHLLIAGDLFDGFTIDTRDWIDTYVLLNEWVEGGGRLTLVAGNHDVSSKGEKVSSFSALAKVLSDSNPERVCVLDIGERGWVDYGVWAIAHHANQDLFELALNEALELQDQEELKVLILHCNFNNTFAQRTDHSLDLSAEMEKKFRAKGVQILLAHEHNHREVGCVKVLGCQFPTSIQDCLENDGKYAHVLKNHELKRIPTWHRLQGYIEIDWRELASAPEYPFIRVIGTAPASEASDVINAIAKFRQKSTAFVVGNAVKVEGLIAADDLPESFEAAKKFDVMNYISQHLDGEEMRVVTSLLEGAR